MNELRWVFIIISGLQFFAAPILHAQKDTEEITRIFSELPEDAKNELMDFARYLKTKETETAEQKQERVYKADNTIPTEKTVGRIMEYSRYLTATQQTPTEKMEEEGLEITKVKFKTRSLDFGKAKEGEVLQLTYHYTNTGKKPMIIYNVDTPCGCTVPEWSKEPLAPGESEVLKITFDTRTKKGNQTKLVKILANTDPKEISLFIKGEIEP